MSDDDHDAFYALGMFPYPSGAAHLGHVRVYTLTDTVARHARLHGARTLHPMGWDAFGLPAENAARQRGVDPAEWTQRNIDQMRRTFRRMGWGFDWDREIDTSDPSYYRWTQSLFLILWRAGLAEQRLGWVFWCEGCATGLANEQVISGACWRCDQPVTRTRRTQWMFRITDYAQRLWDDLDALTDWDPRAVAIQRSWIGRTEGATIRFGALQTFTTRPDTVMGVVAVVVAPEHPWAAESEDEAVIAYVQTALRRNAVERQAERTQSGVPLGRTVPHPLTGEALGVWVADYVLGDHGTGAVMCVPAHDERDRGFAEHVGLPVQDTPLRDGVPDALVEIGAGGPAVAFKLRDWSVGRQRRWGCPIPMVHCPHCGVVPVPDEELPVRLDDPPQRPCPTCGRTAVRETDTLDTFVCSAWYAYRFVDPHATDRAFDPAAVAAWMPIDLYVGGLDHAAQHMLYFRFVTKVLHDLDRVPFGEPVARFVANGMVQDAHGRKMSKRWGNGIDPDEVLDEVSADALKLAVLADNPAERDLRWSARAPHTKQGFLDRFARAVDGFLADGGGGPGSPLAWPNPDDIGAIFGAIDRLDDALHRMATHVACAQVHELYAALRPVLQRPCAHEGAARGLLKAALSAIWPLIPGWVEARWPEAFGPIAGWPDTSGRAVPERACVVQVDGRRVAEVALPADATDEEARTIATGDPRVRARLAGRPVRRTIWVPGRVLNLVLDQPVA